VARAARELACDEKKTGHRQADSGRNHSSRVMTLKVHAPTVAFTAAVIAPALATATNYDQAHPDPLADRAQEATVATGCATVHPNDRRAHVIALVILDDCEFDVVPSLPPGDLT
jgi:hypothetical protein